MLLETKKTLLGRQWKVYQVESNSSLLSATGRYRLQVSL